MIQPVFWLLFVIVICCIFSILFINHRENFQDQHDQYINCRAQGFTKEWCQMTPFIHGSNVCQCENGSLGRYLPGFGAECVCGGYNNVYYGM